MNIDGNANRVAALAFGPKSVILVVGYNKVVCNLDEAINRVKAIACPANCQRFPIYHFTPGVRFTSTSYILL